MTPTAPRLRWGILSTARIGRTAFLPALREAGHDAVVVGGRDLGRTQEYARENGVGRSVEGYQAVVDADDIDVIYIPLPNSLHAEWTMPALQAGKAVLCEKPLCADVEQAERVISVAGASPRPLWEAFVFPFSPQQDRVLELIRDGVIGPVHDVQSQFHFPLDSPTNIRLDPDLGGGALFDVGCYPIRFAQLILNDTPVTATASALWTARGVDLEVQGTLEYAGGGRLTLTCGMRRPYDTFTRVIGDRGELRLTNPFHARDWDTIEIRVQGEEPRVERLGSAAPSFTAALRHIADVIAGGEPPRHTASDDSLATERAMQLLLRSARTATTVRAGTP